MSTDIEVFEEGNEFVEGALGHLDDQKIGDIGC